MNRILGKKVEGASGPLIILLGGVHGNEDTGVHSIINVFRTIEERKIPIKGKLIGLIGNVRAYDKGIRFLDYDLNRCWTEEFVEDLKANHIPELAKAEDIELLDLLMEIEQLVKTYDTGQLKILADLHATSSDNGNFIVIPEDEADQPVIQSLRLPIIIDLEKYLNGTLLEYMHHRGFISFAFEGGLIGSDRALNLHTSGIWEILYSAGMVERRHDHEFAKYDQIMDSFIHKLPHKVSVLYRHKVKRKDCFKMRPGYHNFMAVKKGEAVADDIKGEIIIKKDGMIFMPLYQELGDDGFFVVKEIEGRL